MTTTISQLMATYNEYSGSSLTILLFLVCLIYLYFTEKEAGKKSLLVYGSVVILALFFCPFFAYLITNILFQDNEVYYRIIWMIPVNMVLAYCGVRLIISRSSTYKKVLIGLAFVAILVTSGDYAYDNPTFQKAENAYHIPKEVVAVCKEILPEEEDKWVCALFPSEMISFVRQYSSRIYMPYGRAVLIDRWNLGHQLFELMEEETLNSEVLSDQATDYGCEYIILIEGRTMTVSLENYNYKKINSVAGYQIYKRIQE